MRPYGGSGRIDASGLRGRLGFRVKSCCRSCSVLFLHTQQNMNQETAEGSSSDSDFMKQGHLRSRWAWDVDFLIA